MEYFFTWFLNALHKFLVLSCDDLASNSLLAGGEHSWADTCPHGRSQGALARVVHEPSAFRPARLRVSAAGGPRSSSIFSVLAWHE